MNLLESYISAVIESCLHEDMSSSFDLDHLKTLQDPRQALAYAVQALGRPMGEGSGRKVYHLYQGAVLKIAKNAAGIAQNQTEMAACGSSDLFPRILDSNPGGFWVVVEEAEKMTRVQFREMTGMGWGDFTSAIGGAFPQKLSKERTSDGEVQHNRNTYDKFFTNLFFRKVVSAIKDCKYEPGDISKLDSWGIIRGKPVILDSGYTESVHQSHYQGKQT